MAAALYDPDFGYYARHAETIGSRGDFSTSATLSPALGRAVAAWMRERCRRRPGDPWHVIECGPGDGSLAVAVLEALGWWHRRRFRMHLVECSPTLRQRQKQRLQQYRCVTWHEDMASALHACGGQADIVSNELADAFPVTLLQCDRGIWQEVWLEITSAGALAEMLRPLPPLPASTLLHWESEQIPPGQRIEIGSGFHDWLAGWCPQWKAGAMLTIDYGGRGVEIYQRRPSGTLRAYLHHQRREGLEVYASMGRQDLTADVNFEDLVCWGERCGLTTVRLVSQREFLSAAGIETPDWTVDSFLMVEAGAGSAFLVLEQQRLRD
ncbi:MAG: SAM-dependent methyltransferase [Verrucomicrobiales bacterium]|nr:SAM-dependent methyltransferase [Verrucomicrobiales bacterium]